MVLQPSENVFATWPHVFDYNLNPSDVSHVF